MRSMKIDRRHGQQSHMVVRRTHVYESGRVSPTVDMPTWLPEPCRHVHATSVARHVPVHVHGYSRYIVHVHAACANIGYRWYFMRYSDLVLIMSLVYPLRCGCLYSQSPCRFIVQCGFIQSHFLQNLI